MFYWNQQGLNRSAPGKGKNMKKSFVVSVDSRANSDKDAWLRNIDYLASVGFDGVELALRNPENIDLSVLRRELKKSNISLPAIGTGLAYLEDGLSLSAKDLGIRKKAVARVKKHIEFANEFGSQVIIGLIRGKEKSESTSSKRDGIKCLLDSMEELCVFAEKTKAGLLLEPINRYETSYLANVDECRKFIDLLYNKKVNLMFDTFHANIEEENLIDALRKCGRLLKHVHFADSNRLCPGRGHIDFVSVIKSLKKSGYKHFISGEFSFSPDFKSTSSEFSRYLRRLFTNA